MADKSGVNYRINLNRMKTTKWAQAQPVDYGGDDWGDDDYEDYEPAPQHVPQPLSAPGTQNPPWGQGSTGTSRRSFTNPSPVRETGRLSFDRADERRNFSSGAPGESTSSHAPRPPSPSSQQSFGSSTGGHRNQPSLQLNTQFAGPSPHTTTSPGGRGNHGANVIGAPLSAPGTYTDQWSDSRSRPVQGDPPPGRPHSMVLNNPVATGPPRKSSLSTQQPSTDPRSFAPSLPQAARSTQDNPLTSKPLPFVRPADIYKRVEEEREKERLSQESSRPSMDSATGEVKDARPVVQAPASPQTQAHTSLATPGRPGGYTQPKPQLEPLLESGLSSEATSPQPQSPEQRQNAVMVSRQASSVYSNRRDPVSASSTDSVPLPLPTLPEGPTPTTPTSPVISRQFAPITNTLSNSSVDTVPQQVPEDLPQFQRGIAPASDSQRSDVRPASKSFPDSLKDRSEDLKHQPSVGYTSAVHKAFDNAGRDDLSPSTTTDTIPRSDSVSTSGISPIISKQSNDAGAPDPSRTQAATSVESQDSTRGRPESTATIRPHPPVAEDNDLETPVVPGGFRRDGRPPSSGNSPARHPQNAVAPSVPEPRRGVVSNTTSTSPTRDTTESVPIPTTTVATSGATTRNAMLPSPPVRSTSEEWHDWQTQRQSFHAQHGLEDSTNPSPALSSPVSRAETPAKGTVRDIADKLELHSGRSTPTPSQVQDSTLSTATRPTQQTRLESFRPSIPGGWQSDTMTPTLKNNAGEGGQPIRPPYNVEPNRNVSTESIPTAMAPKNWPSQNTGPLQTAFAAAAAAGTAMAGAFSGSAFTRDTPDDSDSDSEHEAYPGAPRHQQAPESVTRDFASEPTVRQAPRVMETGVSAPLSLSSSKATSEPTSSERQTPVDFPAPLRTNKLGESSPISTRPTPFSPSTASPDEDPEQLQKEIVQSLTPKISNIDEEVAQTERRESPAHLRSSFAREDSSNGYDDLLPREYSSYWKETPIVRDSVSEKSEANLEPQTATTPAIPQDHLASSRRTSSADAGEAKHVVPLSSAQDTSSTHRPLLEQKFSWESDPRHETTRDLQQTLSSVSASHQTEPDRPSTPVREIEPNTSAFDTSTTEATDSPETTVTSGARNPTEPLHAATSRGTMTFPVEKVDFRGILAYDDPQRRIRAFDDNRRLYAEPNGLLDSWLSSLNIPEHADVFITSRQTRPTPSKNASEGRTSTRRDLPVGSGTKQMQEDGKRILAAAGKYGGKAGIAAKGLFSRGKDRLRTASAGDKVPSSGPRRSVSENPSPPASPQSQHSTFPSTAPQLPPPSLDTPVEEVSWSLISSTIDQIFNDPSYQHKHDSAAGQRLSQLGVRGELTSKNGKRYSAGALNDQQPLARAVSFHQNVTGAKLVATGQTSLLATPIPEQHESHRKTDQLQASTGDTSKTAQTARSSAAMPNLDGTARQLNEMAPTKSSARKRRPSSISDVSELSRSPGSEEETNALARNVSPPPDENSNSRSQEVPIFLSHDLSKEAEARQESEAAVSREGHSSLPPYSSAVDKASQNRIAPGTQIVPVTDLRSTRNSERRISERPFSFMGTETYSSVPSYRPGSSPPPITPVDGVQRKSQPEEKMGEPDIMNHPAYRAETESQEDANPLPSSRRPAAEVEQVRHPQPTQRQAEDTTRGYRIPGPYVQEYRPPKPKHSSEQFHLTQSRPHTETAQPAPVAVRSDSRMELKPVPETTVEPVSHREPRPVVEPEKARNRSFGGLFRSRSGSRQREEEREPVNHADNGLEDKKKRKVLFRLNSRTSSLGPSLDDLPEEDIHRAQPNGLSSHKRKLSTDLLRSKAFGLRSTSGDGKKKRSSGLSGLFSRSGNKDRSRPSTAMSQRSDMSGPMQQPSVVSLHRYDSPAPGGAYQSTKAEPHTQYMRSTSRDAHTDNQSSAYHETRGYYEPGKSKGTERDDDLESQPDHLWINTRSDSPFSSETVTSSTATPYTATSLLPLPSASTQPTVYSNSPPVPITRAPRDISYGQDRPYVPPVTPQAQPKPPVQPKPQASAADHVKELYKRSRSPRLGRPPSDELMRGRYDDPSRSLQTPDPVTALGTFSNKKASPIGVQRPEEDQEKPWILTLPSGIGDNSLAEDEMADEFVMVPPHSSDEHVSTVAHSHDHHDMFNSEDHAIGRQEAHSPMHDTDSSRQAREAKRLLLERTPSPFLAAAESNDTKTYKPQTVAERFMGIQGPGRSTTPQVSPPTRHTPFMGSVETGRPLETHQNTVSRGDTIATTTSMDSSQGSRSNKTKPTIQNSVGDNNDNDSSNNYSRPRLSIDSKLNDHRVSQPRSITPLSQIQPRSQHNSRDLHRQSNDDENGHAGSDFAAPVELPGSKPEGYESEDEPIMSATAYPGQEWMPVWSGEDGRWDD